MRALTLLLVAMMMLAGCTGSDDGDADPTGTTSGTNTGTTSGTNTGTTTSTGTTSPPSNTTNPQPGNDAAAPVAKLTVSSIAGTAPLVLNITVDATDADEDLAAWVLDFGEGNTTQGETFPTDLNYTYSADGNYTLTLTVTDATGLTANNSIAIVVEAGGLGALTMTAELDLPCVACTPFGTSSCVWRTTGGLTPADCFFLELPTGLAGTPFTLTGEGGDVDALIWTEACGSGEYVSDHKTAGEESGTLPADYNCFLVWAPFDPLVVATLTVG